MQRSALGELDHQGRALSQKQAGPWRSSPLLWVQDLFLATPPGAGLFAPVLWTGIGGRSREGDEATAGAQPATHDMATCSAPAGLDLWSEIGAQASLSQRAVLRMKEVTT